MDDLFRSETPGEVLKGILQNRGGDGLDLSEFDFEDLSAVEQYTFENCTLSAATIRGSLAGSVWKNCTFLNCKFVGAILRDSRFEKCSFFDNALTTGSQYRFCDLVRVQFDGCNVTLSEFLRCEAYEIVFRDCLLRGVIFESTSFQHTIGKKYFSKATFERCRLPDASLAKLDLTGAKFDECDLANANLAETRLVNSTMTNCDLYGVELERTDLSGADLRKSDLSGFDLTLLAGYVSMRISPEAQHHLLASIGIEVWPD